MRRFLILLAIALLIIYTVEFLAYLALKPNFSVASYNFGILVTILLYVVLELIVQKKDRFKGGAVADIKITVQDANDPEQVGEAIKTGIQTFDVLRKMGKRTKELISEKKSKEKSEDENPKEEV